MSRFIPHVITHGDGDGYTKHVGGKLAKVTAEDLLAGRVPMTTASRPKLMGYLRIALDALREAREAGKPK